MRRSHQGPARRVRAERQQPTVRMLDRALANGVPPNASPDWLLRSRELCSPSQRSELARSLVEVLQTAQHAVADPLTRLDAPAILRCSKRLLALVTLLEDECSLRVKGLALARLLFEDPESPLFRAHPGQSLDQALDEITDAL